LKIEGKVSIIVLDAGEIFIIRTVKITRSGSEQIRMKTMTEIRIEDLIPHRGRMKLVDDVLEISDITAKTSSRVTGQWPLDESGAADPVVLIELIAQTAGVMEGWKSKQDGGRPEKSGWLVGIKKCDFYVDGIPAQIRLTTTVRRLYALEAYAVFAGEVASESGLICRAELQVFRTEAESGSGADPLPQER
jgi:predicted hotdog family 3-hydroxylacyl-ACP dehydratase